MIKGVNTVSEKHSIKEYTDTRSQRPNLYRVYLLNDNYTTMDFVVEILVQIFHKPREEAKKIMLDVHKKGRGIVGIYTYDIALTKILQVEETANQNGFPLKAGMEEE